MTRRSIGRAGLGVILIIVVGACSGAAPTTAPSPASSIVATTPEASASPSPAESVTPTEAPTASTAPKASPKALPSFDQAELDAYLTSSITLIDLADDDLAVSVSYVDPGSDASIDLGTYALDSTDQMTNQVPPGIYRLAFRQPAGSATGPTCTIEVTDADGYIFAAVKGSIAISRTGTKPAKAADIFVATSALCRK